MKKLKQLKKLIGLVVICLFAFSLFAGCGGGTTPPSAAATTPTSTPTSTPEATPESTPEATPDNPATDDPPTELSGTVSTSGSTSVDKVLNSLIEAFRADHPGVVITYESPGSSAGINDAAEGAVDIGLSSRALKDSETGLDAHVFALDGIAIIVNNSSTVTDLTKEQIAGLYTGEITNWKDVGGEDGPVALVGREPGSGTRDGFEDIIGVKEKCLYDQEQTSTGAVITAVEANPNAIGYASLSALKDTVKKVTVNGVACTEETVLDGSYAVQRPFVFVTITGKELSAEAKAFLEFSMSPEVAEIIANAGAVQPR